MFIESVLLSERDRWQPLDCSAAVIFKDQSLALTCAAENIAAGGVRSGLPPLSIFRLSSIWRSQPIPAG